MTEEQLRALVRDAVARHLGTSLPEAPSTQPPAAPAGPLPHPSHALFRLPAGGEAGACIIEPAVPCTHCGYCKSYGH